MPKIDEQIVISFPKEAVFKQITSTDFMKAIDPNFGHNTTVLFENERLMRSISKVEGIGDVEIERITIPEAFAIITQRRQPLPPFIYQLSIQILFDHNEETLLKWTNEFELDPNNQHREAAIVSILRRNDAMNLKNMEKQLKDCLP
ncbi:MAG: hypothetical protein ABSG74_13870 [Candidatus Bathyarchaeia archaeon]|jgi:hypothetical protein